ncbi:hypothetical protein FKP32DRAFT_1206054 [Trametes sanguinea]|nr:hypothetical protein FKP32DRAFT_1206054 [Trametes sanguinea]
MSKLFRRFLRTSWSSNLTNPYQKDPVAKAAIEQKVSIAASLVDPHTGASPIEQGAVEAIITSTAHAGGTDDNEAQHVCVRYLKEDHTYVRTKVKTPSGETLDTATHHLYITNEELRGEAEGGGSGSAAEAQNADENKQN